VTKLRLLALPVVVVLLTASAAQAAIFVRLTTTAVHRGGVLRLIGDASGMPLYALPAARYPCARTGTCTAPLHRASAPGRPFVLLGRVPAAPATRAFRIRLPRILRPGRYKVFVWCAQCGGSLIVAGSDDSGQTLRVLP
jgi:hypothetical protein